MTLTSHLHLRECIFQKSKLLLIQLGLIYVATTTEGSKRAIFLSEGIVALVDVVEMVDHGFGSHMEIFDEVIVNIAGLD